jgi:hypothetical protein
VILSVDAVAFRPLVTISETGEVKGFKSLNQLHNPGLFSQYLTNPQAFVSFLKDHWDDAYPAMIVLHMQPVSPDFPCSISHVIPEVKGKETAAIVAKLLELETILRTQFHCQVVGLAFDGDSCFNNRHDQFRRRWIAQILRDSMRIPFDIQGDDVICGPLHFLKRIRYHWVSCALLSMGFGSDVESSFSLSVIRSLTILSPVGLLNTQITKMHDSLPLPLRLFSPRTFSEILQRGPSPEHVLSS